VAVGALGPDAGALDVAVCPCKDLLDRQRLETSAAAPTNVARHGIESKKKAMQVVIIAACGSQRERTKHRPSTS
jgi:hypothetical protein